MARYLVVAHQTATSPLLLDRCSEIARDDPRAEFTLLVPATHVSHALVCDEAETQLMARQRADEAAASFRGAGLRVREAIAGVDSPVGAVADELRLHPDEHDAVVLSTLARGVSRWVRMDVPRRVRHATPLPVLHVHQGDEGEWAASAELRRAIATAPRREAPAAEEQPAPVAGWSSYRLPIAGLLAVHAVLMVGLGVSIDAGFFGIELLVLGFLAFTLALTPWMESGELWGRGQTR